MSSGQTDMAGEAGEKAGCGAHRLGAAALRPIFGLCNAMPYFP